MRGLFTALFLMGFAGMACFALAATPVSASSGTPPGTSDPWKMETLLPELPLARSRALIENQIDRLELDLDEVTSRLRMACRFGNVRATMHVDPVTVLDYRLEDVSSHVVLTIEEKGTIGRVLERQSRASSEEDLRLVEISSTWTKMQIMNRLYHEEVQFHESLGSVGPGAFGSAREECTAVQLQKQRDLILLKAAENVLEQLSRVEALDAGPLSCW